MLEREVGAVSDADPVPLTEAPSVILAESLCGMLRSNGIEAFYKRTGIVSGWGGATSDFGPAEIWVSAANVERARALLPEG
jgi:hypothetical protein